MAGLGLRQAGLDCTKEGDPAESQVTRQSSSDLLNVCTGGRGHTAPVCGKVVYVFEGGKEQTRKTQDELQWIVAQRLLSALTIPGFS